MVVHLFDYWMIVKHSCVQGSKFYLDKHNWLAACVIESRAVKFDELSRPYICEHAVISFNLSLFIKASME